MRLRRPRGAALWRVGWVDGPTLNRDDYQTETAANTRETWLRAKGNRLVCVYRVYGFEENPT